MEVLVASNLRILHLEQGLTGILAQWTVDFHHELLSIAFHFLKDFIYILFDSKKICLDAFLLEELDGGHLPLSQQVWPRHRFLYLIFEVSEKTSKQFVGDEVRQLGVV